MDKSTKKRATITQVAKHAGVSVGTVSNYLNGTAGVSHDSQGQGSPVHHSPGQDRKSVV